MAECNVHIIKEDKFFEVLFEAFLTGRRVAVFWKNGMKKFFLILGEVGTVPKWDKNPERTQYGPIWAIAGL